MKKIIFLILPIILLLNACSSHQNYPVNVTKDKFIDPNPPTINITFPFNIYLNRREVEKEENARIIAYDLYTSSMKEEDVLKRLLGTDGGD